MKCAVIVFPGSNCDRDVAKALERTAQSSVLKVWHKETSLPENIDLVVLPGGFSFGDYLRCGAIAARSPIVKAVIAHAQRGGYILGICNGFQILTELDLLPGTLMRNTSLTFVCKTVPLRIEAQSAFTALYGDLEQIHLPVAHHDGCYVADAHSIQHLHDEERIALRYLENPNGSAHSIAGILSPNRRILGLMPHPERACEAATGGSDGAVLFQSLAHTLQQSKSPSPVQKGHLA